jgi:hypothetical protein
MKVEGECDETYLPHDGSSRNVFFDPATAWGRQALTVGDLLDKGAKKLTQEEIRTLYTEATVSGVQAGKPEVYIPKQAYGRWFSDR